MPASLGSLMAVSRFGFRPLYPLDEAQVDRSVVWAHSSDLLDPTPWLESDQLLLTDGAQFTTKKGLAQADDYFERLRERGVAGVGFAVDVIHPRVPAEIVAAGARQAVALLEVPGSTPFISVIRHVADIGDAERSARLHWSLEAQRAVARAAVRDDGLREILRTLSRRLETWVTLYDATGSRVKIPGVLTTPARWSAMIDREAWMLLEKGAPAGLRTQQPYASTLQTIGQRGRLRGVLAVGAETPLDPAENDLVGSVIALASIALEQQRALDASRRRLRTGLLELLVAGQMAVADRTAAAVWGRLPDPPFLVGFVPGPIDRQSFLDELELLCAARPRFLFFAERADDVVILSDEGGLDDARQLLERHERAIGLAAVTGWGELTDALAEAAHAASAAHGPGMVRFDDIARDGVLGMLRTAGGATVAHSILSPLRDLPGAEQERLWTSARAWLDANTAWDPAARALGIHRHTLRARIDQLGTLLGVDLTTFGGRAELWAAMELVQPSWWHPRTG